MTEPIITGTAIAAGWKILGSLYEKYQAWSVRKSISKESKVLNARAEELMKKINAAILCGASSDDPSLSPLIKEFRALLSREIKPSGHERTEEWIGRSKAGAVVVKKAAAKPMAKKAAAKKPAAKKPAAKKTAAKPTAKKAAAKKPAAKRATTKRA